MKSPFLKTYLALALLGGLAAYIYFFERKQPAGGEAQPKEKVFAGFDQAKARELQLAPSEGESVVVAKDGESWHLREPKPAAADASTVESLLRSIESLELDEVVSETPARLADFGLENPRRRVSVTLEGAPQPLTLLFGDKTPDGGSVYAKTPDRPRVFTLPAHLETSLGKSAFDLRDRDLLHVDREAVRALRVSGPGERYALARAESGEWAFSEPLVTRAGRWAIDGLIGTLEGLRMEKVAAEEAGPSELGRYGLDKPKHTLTLTLADGATKTLEIGSSPEPGKHHARVAGSPLVAVIPGALVDDLAKGMAELRMKRLADVATYDVEGFDVTAGGSTWSYAKSTEKDKDGFETSKWKRTAPDAKEIDRQKLEDALYKLTGLEVQEFVDAPGPAAAYGLDAPALAVTLRLSGGKPPVSVEIARKDGAAYARRPGDAAVLKLDLAKVDEAEKELLAL